MNVRGFIASAVLALAGGGLLAAFDPSTIWWFPSCPFHAITGWECPLCGSLRAIHALVHGAPFAALALNPLTIAGIAGFALARERTAAFCFSTRGLATLAAFGLLRNVPALSGWLGQ
jgi:Protein of unknown function (DUF2752)